MKCRAEKLACMELLNNVVQAATLHAGLQVASMFLQC